MQARSRRAPAAAISTVHAVHSLCHRGAWGSILQPDDQAVANGSSSKDSGGCEGPQPGRSSRAPVTAGTRPTRPNWYTAAARCISLCVRGLSMFCQCMHCHPPLTRLRGIAYLANATTCKMHPSVLPPRSRPHSRLFHMHWISTCALSLLLCVWLTLGLLQRPHLDRPRGFVIHNLRCICCGRASLMCNVSSARSFLAAEVRYPHRCYARNRPVLASTACALCCRHPWRSLLLGRWRTAEKAEPGLRMLVRSTGRCVPSPLTASAAVDCGR